MHVQPCRTQRSFVLAQELSVLVEVFYVKGASIVLTVSAHLDYLRLVEIAGQISIRVVIPSGVEELDTPILALSEHALAWESKDVSYFEFLAITVPLVERLEYLRSVFEIVDSPQTYNAGIAGLRHGGKYQAAQR